MKRLLDMALSASAGILLLPLLIVIVLAILAETGGPILFVQERPGYRGRIFRLYKFRTMRNLKGSGGELLPDGERLTPVGRFLRKWSLDELPELWNVLRGDMSIVGPRPLLPQYLERYSPEQARRHEVKPGLTGWAQVRGRNAIAWEEKFALDVWYVDNRSFLLDLGILFLTAWKVLKREGISADGAATMPEFLGTERKGEHPHRG